MTFHSNGMGHPVRFFGVRDELADKFAGSVRVLAWSAVDGSHALQVTCNWPMMHSSFISLRGVRISRLPATGCGHGARDSYPMRLHEKGARVRVEASGAAVPFAEPPATTPQHFLYNQPFFAFLWREDAEWPYFGAWIGDESTLEPFQG